MGVFKTEMLNSVDSEIRAAMESAGKTPGLEGVAEKYTAATGGVALARELEGQLGKKAASALVSSERGITGRDLALATTGAALGHPTQALAFLAGKGLGARVQARVEPWMAQMAYNNTFGTKAAAATQSMKGQIGEAMKSYFATAAKAASKTPTKAAAVVTSESRTKPQMDRKGYETMSTRAEQLVSKNHQDKVQRYIETMHQAGYEELAAAMMAVNQRAVNYASWNAVPRKATKGMNSLRPQPVDKTPSLQEWKYDRKMRGVMRGPLGLLEDMKNGSASRDQVQATAYVYPESVRFIAETFGAEVVAMKARGETLPMDKINNLGIALNAPIDRTLEGDYVKAVQVALNAPGADKPPPQQPSVGTIGPSSQALMTPLQGITFQV